jgi:hypothetical protein
MTRDETIALFLKGKDAWNAWAEDMLAQRKALEESGQWQFKADQFGSFGTGERCYARRGSTRPGSTSARPV